MDSTSTPSGQALRVPTLPSKASSAGVLRDKPGTTATTTPLALNSIAWESRAPQTYCELNLTARLKTDDFFKQSCQSIERWMGGWLVNYQCITPSHRYSILKVMVVS